MKRILLPAASLALALAALPVHAKGDPDQGKALFYTCTGCHGIVDYKNAYPNYRVPKVGGQNEQYLVAALTAYRNGDRQHPTMRAQAESFTDQEIADIAAFLHQVEQEGGTLLFPGELNPVFASGFGAGLAAVILVLLLVIAGKPRLFPDQPAPRAADDDEERKG